MKTYDEMIESLFERRDEYVHVQAKKRKTAVKTGLSLCCVCLVALVGVGIFKTDSDQIKSPTVIEKTTVNSSEPVSDKKIEISLFSASAPETDNDSFGDDELSHIDIVLGGNRTYVQIDKADYEKYGLKSAFSESDFGKKVGVMTEIDALTSADSEIPSSQEPSLKGCDAYYYAPAGNEAIVIVKGNGHCSAFVFFGFTEDGHSISEMLKIFGITSSAELKSVEFEVFKTTGAIYEKQYAGRIDNRKVLDDIYGVLMQLKAYKVDDPHMGTPDWLNEAYEKYDFTESVYITISFFGENGFTFSTEYMPNLASGYVDSHEFLTDAQSEIFNSAFLKD